MLWPIKKTTSTNAAPRAAVSPIQNHLLSWAPGSRMMPRPEARSSGHSDDGVRKLQQRSLPGFQSFAAADEWADVAGETGARVAQQSEFVDSQSGRGDEADR